MAKTRSEATAALALICGDDEHAVKEQARAAYDDWTKESQGFDHEIVDAAAGNVSEALAALNRLDVALNTLPFFGGPKVVWFKNCAFLGDERAAGSKAVTDRLGRLGEQLKAFDWTNVRLLISAGKVDRRKAFYKTVDKLGRVTLLNGWSADDKNWSALAEQAARKQFADLGKTVSSEALGRLVSGVGPNARQLSGEVEKAALYVGDRERVELEDIERVSIQNKQGQAFELGEALGARDFPRALKALDNELWGSKGTSQKPGIGLLYGLIQKIRVLLFLKEMQRLKWLGGEAPYNQFKAQLERVPSDSLPADKRLNPVLMHPFVLYKALPQTRNYTSAELTAAMSVLLECNRELIYSGLEESMALQRALGRIISRGPVEASGSLRARAA